MRAIPLFEDSKDGGVNPVARIGFDQTLDHVDIAHQNEADRHATGDQVKKQDSHAGKFKFHRRLLQFRQKTLVFDACLSDNFPNRLMKTSRRDFESNRRAFTTFLKRDVSQGCVAFLQFETFVGYGLRQQQKMRVHWHKHHRQRLFGADRELKRRHRFAVGFVAESNN